MYIQHMYIVVALFLQTKLIENIMTLEKSYQSCIHIIVFRKECFISQEQGLVTCEQLYLTTLLQLLYLQSCSQSD